MPASKCPIWREVYLPCATEAIAPASAPALHPNSAQLGGSENILLVEYESAVRTTIEAVLVRYGYRLRSAGSGAEALEMWLDHGSEIDLLLTGVIMPDRLTGKKLAEDLLRQKPSLRVIYMSGYNQEFDGSNIVREGGNYLVKPFAPNQLLAALRASLNAGADGALPLP